MWRWTSIPEASASDLLGGLHRVMKEKFREKASLWEGDLLREMGNNKKVGKRRRNDSFVRGGAKKKNIKKGKKFSRRAKADCYGKIPRRRKGKKKKDWLKANRVVQRHDDERATQQKGGENEGAGDVRARRKFNEKVVFEQEEKRWGGGGACWSVRKRFKEESEEGGEKNKISKHFSESMKFSRTWGDDIPLGNRKALDTDYQRGRREKRRGERKVAKSLEGRKRRT